jgi:hypothetical protein
MKPFRTIDEIKTFLKAQREAFLQEESLFKISAAKISTRLTAAGDVKIMDFSGDGKIGPKRPRTINVDFPVVKVPNMQELQKNYGRAAKYSEQYKVLVATENEIRMNFRNATNKNLQYLLGSFAKLKADMEKAMRELFEFLHSVAQKHAPKEYQDFIKAVASELESKEHIECDAIDSFTYVALSKEEQLVFAGYIILKNAVSDDGKIAPHIYVTIKWTVGGDVEVFVEHEFIPPSLLEQGTVVSDTKKAVASIANQLAMEGFSAQIGNLPVAMQLKMPAGGLNKEAFSAASAIHSVHSEKDELIFELKPTVKGKEREEVKNQLFLELKNLRKSRNVKMRMADKGLDIIFTFTNLDQSSGITFHDLEFLQDRYRLSDPQLRKIVNTING